MDDPALCRKKFTVNRKYVYIKELHKNYFGF